MKKFTLIFIAIIAFALPQPTFAQTNDYASTLSDCAAKSIMDVNSTGCMIGVAAPDFTARTVDGKVIRLADLKGKVVVLNFWFIACAPCHVEAPVMKKISGEFSKDDVVFIAIAREKDADLKKYLADEQFFANNIADPKSAICKNVYRVFGFPTTIVVDKTGKIQYYSLGGMTSEAAVDKVLHAKLVPAIKGALENKTLK
ncbi:TlpA disulfide reductase family protein [Mucilaginibacter sp.]|jgi:peroxiredoxin|uniref:peroxiredoxin family protein n=1 Tax=Mucilaginibacter sp. TaxID=1882438 RepID=UPI002C1839FB|nr:TlpA disulfide reductase family protein [Mucilaginibacter sp.]HTI59118.1 TlpA disulfide reductase family protein [Mucilaginibacter sp.]